MAECIRGTGEFIRLDLPMRVEKKKFYNCLQRGREGWMDGWGLSLLPLLLYKPVAPDLPVLSAL